MPYENEHSCRLTDPEKYDDFRRENEELEVGDDGKAADVIYGIIENEDGDDKSEMQAVRFSVDKFDEDEARDWCKNHDSIKFEPAADEDKAAPTFEGPKRDIEETKIIQPSTVDDKGVTIDEREMDGKDYTTITMPISSTGVDRDFDNFTKDALDSMRDQLSTGRVGLFLDHGGPDNNYEALKMVGGFIDADLEGDTLYATAALDPDDDNADKLKSKLENNLPIGFSVGFANAQKSENQHGGHTIDDVDLAEVSAVGIPSNPDAIVSFAEMTAKRAVELATKDEEALSPDNEDIDKMSDEEKDKQEEDGEENAEPADEAVAILAEYYDMSPAEIWDALDEAGITDEENEGDVEETDGVDEETIREIVRDELDKAQSDKDAEEDDEKTSDKSTTADDDVKEPAGKILTPKDSKGEGEDPDPDDEGGDDGLSFNPKL